jgi:Mn-dependent DtxR family transcriptional regulator
MMMHKNNMDVIKLLTKIPVWLRILKELKEHKLSDEKEPIFVSELAKRMQPVSWCQVLKVINDLEKLKYIRTTKKHRKRFIVLSDKGDKATII